MRQADSYKTTMIWWAIVVGILASSGLVAKADFTFGEPVNLGSVVNSPRDGMNGDDAPTSFSSDGLEMYFLSRRAGGQGLYDIWVTKREAVDDEWGTPVNLG